MRKILMFCLVGLLVLAGCSTETKKNGEVVAGFIYNGSITDGGYNQAHDAGRLEVEKELGVKTVYSENVKEADFEKVAKSLIDQGATVIFATSFEFMEPTVKLSKAYPNIKFYHCSGYQLTDNMANYFGRIYQARYLAGIVAARMSKSNQLGFVGAFPIPEVIGSINAFTLGAKSVNPNVTVEVQWSNTWFDPVAEKEAAKTLISHGVDVIAQHQNTTAVQQAAEEAGIYGIGYNLDMSSAAPKANLTSNVWHWGVFYVEAVKRVQENRFESKAYFDGLDTGLVGMAPFNSVVPQTVVDEVNEMTKQIADGSKNVFEGPIKGQDGKIVVESGKQLSDEEIVSMDYFVEGVIGQIK